MADFFQAEVSLGSISALEQRTSEAVREPVEEAREYVKTQSAVNMDETGWHEGTQRAWLWVAATTWVTVFLIRLRVCEIIMTSYPKGQARRHFHSYVRLRVPFCSPVLFSNLTNRHGTGSSTSQFCVPNRSQSPALAWKGTT